MRSWSDKRTRARIDALEREVRLLKSARTTTTAAIHGLSDRRAKNDRSEIEATIDGLLSIVDPASRPNVNALWAVARDLPAAHLNVKFFGYDLAERLRAALPVKENLFASKVGLKSKACTQEDIESDWVDYWCSEYKIPRIFHRKLWELCYFNQALYEHDFMRPGMRGLGFGCGSEPIPSYLASKRIYTVATDVPVEHDKAAAWGQTNQHAITAQHLYKAALVDQDRFDEFVSHKFVDMNHVPSGLKNFDFCWSICSLEHLGSIANGIKFIENSLNTLRPGGLAIHTTEFNFFDDKRTIDNWGTVFFHKRHFIEIKNRLESQGHKVEPLDFNVGNKPMDRFIDIAPFQHEWSSDAREWWAGDQRHLKLEWDGFIVTCFGLIITKAS